MTNDDVGGGDRINSDWDFSSLLDNSEVIESEVIERTEENVGKGGPVETWGSGSSDSGSTVDSGFDLGGSDEYSTGGISELRGDAGTRRVGTDELPREDAVKPEPEPLTNEDIEKAADDDPAFKAAMIEYEKAAENYRKQLNRVRTKNEKNRINVGSDVNMDDVRQVAAAAYQVFLKHDRLNIDKINELLAGYVMLGPYDVAEIMQMEVFDRIVQDYGVPKEATKNLLTHKQIMTLTAVFGPGTATFSTRLKKAGVTQAEWQTWLKQPEFYKMYSQMSEAKLVNSVPIYISALSDKAADGDLQSIKLALEITDRYNPNKEDRFNSDVFLRRILEVLQIEIRDGEKLMRIANKLKAVQEDVEEKARLRQQIIRGELY